MTHIAQKCTTSNDFLKRAIERFHLSQRCSTDGSRIRAVRVAGSLRKTNKISKIKTTKAHLALSIKRIPFTAKNQTLGSYQCIYFAY